MFGRSTASSRRVKPRIPGPAPAPRAPPRPVRSSPASDPGITREVDPDFLEHLRCEAMDQPELPWEP